jgi:DNA-directed RNA polymerase subunit D
LESEVAMEIEVLETDGLDIKFLLKDSNPAFANTLRRTILTEVPTLAIAEVIVLENSSPLYDEIIAHRLGLIPLVTPLEDFNLPEQCECGGVGCPACEIHLELLHEGSALIDTVYSEELAVTTDPESPVKAVIPKIPILKLSRHQRVHIECIARLGQGRNHARWQPVATISYKYYPVVDIDKEKCVICQECIPNCPPKILELQDDELVCIAEDRCILCNMCVDTCQYDAIHVTGDDNRFLFSMSATGALDPQKILLEAFNFVKKIATEFNADLDQLEVSE